MRDQSAPQATSDRPAEPSVNELIVSVVIPTRNRSGLLREAIAALWQQTLPAHQFEIVVVDNCSTDDTPQTVAELIRHSPCQITYHRMEQNRGPARSRNRGVELARGALIAFTDSDCRPAPDWLARGIEPFRKPAVALVTGQVRYKPEQSVRFFSRATGEVATEHASYPTSNAWYRRKTFQELGGFDVKLCFRDFRNRPVECADTDLAWRLKEAGYANVFVRGLIVYHEVETLPPWNWAVELFRLFVVPALVRRHPQLRTKLLAYRLFFARENVLFYLAVLGLLLGSGLHWAWAALAAPYVLWASAAGKRKFTLRDLPKTPVRPVLLGARHAFMCAGLLYGSLRFRALVL